MSPHDKQQWDGDSNHDTTVTLRVAHPSLIINITQRRLPSNALLPADGNPGKPLRRTTESFSVTASLISIPRFSPVCALLTALHRSPTPPAIKPASAKITTKRVLLQEAAYLNGNHF